MRRIRYYLDTTVLNFVFANVEPEKKALTVRFLRDIPKNAEGICISDEVLREVSRAPEPRRTQLEELIRQIGPRLIEIDEEMQELADRYVKEGIIPERYHADALHIAAAVVNEIEAIVSWNFEHIVKLKTRMMVNGVNRLMGYREIEICSPQEVVES